MSWWEKVKGKISGVRGQHETTTNVARPAVSWLDAAANPFGVPVLDLTPVTRGLISTTRDPAVAARAVSWQRSTGSELDAAELRDLAPVECDLRYPVAKSFPDGIVFAPSCMEEKWVIAHRAGVVLAARSWTGVVEATAATRRDGNSLVVQSIRVRETSALRTVGDLVQVFDWLLRSHALDQLLPLPVDETTAGILQEVPLFAFSAFGSKAVCAALSWAPSPPNCPLRSDGAVLVATRAGDVKLVRALCEGGEDVDAPSTFQGYAPLSVALVRGDTNMVRALLELGASPLARSDGGNFPLGHGIVHIAPIAVLEALVARGADPNAVNDDGFGTLHAAAEVGNADAVRWLVGLGLNLEARTGAGHTPLQIACALGRIEAVEALLDAGANLEAGSPGGSARDIAVSERKDEVVALLERRRQRAGVS